MALRLQQVLCDVPIANLQTGESVRSFVHNLSSRLGILTTDLQQQFQAILGRVFASALGFWICDYVAIVCADSSISSSDPEEHTILQPTGVLAWCQSTTQELKHRVVGVVKSGATTAAQPDHIIELSHATKMLLAIAEAVRAALRSRRYEETSRWDFLQLLCSRVQDCTGDALRIRIPVNARNLAPKGSNRQSAQQREVALMQKFTTNGSSSHSTSYVQTSDCCCLVPLYHLLQCGSRRSDPHPTAAATNNPSAAMAGAAAAAAPGQPPLIARSSIPGSLSRGSGFNPLISSGASGSKAPGFSPIITPQMTTPIEPFGPRTAPAYVSLPGWQEMLTQLRKDTPPDRSSNSQGKLFLDDLIDQLLNVSEGQRAVDYPYSDVLSCVEGLFLSGSSSNQAWRAKLAVLLYYLLDGGWITSAAPFAQGFQLPLTLAQQWQCHYLMDHANSSSSGGAAGGSSSSSHNLDDACKLLGAIASPSTPFRFVEALLAAGRATTALAVQRARCATSGGDSAAVPVSLSEAQVLLKVQLACGLLPEAFSELRRHCSQLSQPERSRQIRALIQQLADWAAAAAVGNSTQQQQQPSRLQQLCQLPFNAEEESVLLGYLRSRMMEGNPVGQIVPLYLLQRGRSLEALKAYADYQASPAAAAAAAASTDAGGGAIHQRQLQTLMSAAAAALPPNLRHTAVATGSSSSSSTITSILAGLGVQEADMSRSAAPFAILQSRGIEQPTFMTQLVPASVAGDGGLLVSDTTPFVAAAAASDAAAGAGLPAAAAGAHNSSTFWKGFTNTPAAAGSSNDQFPGSLFGEEVAAAAGPGVVSLNPSTQGLANTPAAAADGDYVPLLFGTPAPAGRSDRAGFSSLTSTAGLSGPGLIGLNTSGFNTPGFNASGYNTQDLSGPSGFNMTEEDFNREVLGIQGSSKEGKGLAGRGKRTIKRQRQAPGPS